MIPTRSDTRILILSENWRENADPGGVNVETRQNMRPHLPLSFRGCCRDGDRITAWNIQEPSATGIRSAIFRPVTLIGRALISSRVANRQGLGGRSGFRWEPLHAAA